MRKFLMLLAASGLAACDRTPTDPPTPEAKPAALTYEGAAATAAAARLAHGARLSKVLGCAGCHGDDYAGTNVTEGDAQWGDFYAANLSILMPTYTLAEFDKAVRAGVPKDGHAMQFMPSEAFTDLSDADIAALYDHLRTAAPKGAKMPPHRPGPIFNKMVADGHYKDAQDAVARWKGKGPVDLGAEHAFGRHIARTTCTECHDLELTGTPGFSPDLDIAGLYNAAELDTLLTTGKGKSKLDLGLMAMVAKTRFAQLTPTERKALVDYLLARAAHNAKAAPAKG